MLNTPPAASRLGPAQTRRLRGPPPRAAPLSSAALEEERVVDAFQRTFAGVAGAQRCLASWLRLARGSPSFERSSELGLQSAHSYVEGLEARPWHDPATYAWLRVLEQHSGTIQKELDQALKPERAALLERTGESIWAPPARDDATAYGPQWRTLVLQDRGEWSPANAPLFPETTRLVRDVARAPSLEVFFARQAPNSGAPALCPPRSARRLIRTCTTSRHCGAYGWQQLYLDIAPGAARARRRPGRLLAQGWLRRAARLGGAQGDCVRHILHALHLEREPG